MEGEAALGLVGRGGEVWGWEGEGGGGGLEGGRW